MRTLRNGLEWDWRASGTVVVGSGGGGLVGEAPGGLNEFPKHPKNKKGDMGRGKV